MAEEKPVNFDDCYRLEVWNEINGNRMVLLIRFKRMFRIPGNVVCHDLKSEALDLSKSGKQRASLRFLAGVDVSLLHPH